MTKKTKAVEVVENKLWFTYDSDGNKSGILRPDSNDPDWLIHYLLVGENIAYSRDEIENMFNFEGKRELSSWHHKHVFGYPVPEIETFKTQERDGLPCFTKTSSSKVYFAAGHYGINFDNGGWMEAFCPKLATLRKYEFIGPFKTATDAQIAVKRKLRNYE